MKNTKSTALLILLSCVSVLSYMQFVDPDVTHADSSTIHNSGGVYPYWPNRTVDGNTSQDIKACLHTAISNVSEAWLRIDLQSVKSVKSVKFWYRNDRGTVEKSLRRLRGYNIRVSKNENIQAGSADVCFTDNKTKTLTTVIQDDCKKTARYIWFYQQEEHDPYNKVPILEICEVQIFGCELGEYGINCTRTCSHCKNNLHCDIDTGQCDELGCAQQGFQAPNCTDCVSGLYGSDCNSTCSVFCAQTSCNRYTAECINGCKPGYQQPTCNETCMSGTYGEMCTEACGFCLNSRPCENVNGTCSNGCEKGFKGYQCKTMCSDGEYGESCRSSCSKNCYANETCDRFFGNCSNCADGFQNLKCDERCNKGTYGKDCESTCGNCLDGPCNHVDGTCSKGCKAGWQATNKCDLPCENGTFGIRCKHACSGNCLNNETCDKTLGECIDCAPGWEGKLCDKTCDIGRYGSNCLQECGQCLNSENCSQTDGSCSGGCLPGNRGEKCTEKIVAMSVEVPETTDAGDIAAPVAIIFVLTSIIVVVVIIRQKRPPKEDICVQMQAIPEQDEEVVIPAGDEVYYTNHQIHTKLINILELKSLINLLEYDVEDGFEKEFRAIPFGEQPDIPCTIGKLPENIIKNRFKTTFPYDHSRVILESSENGDYINANFIKNAYGETAYIASQGPRANTVVHFWQMVWQENVTVIAMVTNLMEEATIKCERYWPKIDGGKIVKGKFTIHLVSTKTYAIFAIHELKVSNNQTKKARLVTHLQYTGWPDHGTPSPLELLAYHRYVSKAMEKRPERKLLVHCSAGIGRTGTFIALDTLRDMGEKEGRINIVEFVHTMREDRMNMIQNVNQYRFLYYVLHESFRAKGRVLSKTEFIQDVDSEIASKKAVNLSKFMKEFNELASIKPVLEEKDLKFGKQNYTLNMNKNVLPADKMRVILSSHVPGRSTYVNAVPISTFTMKDCLIAAQYPVKGAAVDLIRLLIDQECSVLVSINPLSEISSTVEWFSLADRRCELFNYEVEILSTSKMSDHVRQTNMRMKRVSDNEWNNVIVYEFASWHLKDDLPVETIALLDLVKFIMQGPKIDYENKMALLSRDGVTGCGVFCTVYNAIEQLQLDGEVDIFTVVRHLQSRRPEMIASMNEYSFCCQAVAQFIKSESGMEDDYMNSQSENDESIYANVAA